MTIFCNHKDDNGQELFVWIERDARGIPIGHVCDNCFEAKKSEYKPEIFTDPNYEADEPIEPEDY